MSSCAIFFVLGGGAPLQALAEADRADIYEHLVLLKGDERAAVASPRNPGDQLLFGFIPETRLFGSAAAVIRENCLSRAIATLARRCLQIPREGITMPLAWQRPGHW